MAQFRKKPVVIEAVQFANDASGYALLEWANGLINEADRSAPFIRWENAKLFIPTLEGEMTASPGDWIIRGVHGEFYPCKPDIFAATYEVVA